MFSENSRIKLEINNRHVFGKFPNIWKVNNTLLITHCVVVNFVST